MAEVFPVIPSGIPAQTAADIGRAPDFCFDETGRSGAFQLVDGAVQISIHMPHTWHDRGRGALDAVAGGISIHMPHTWHDLPLNHILP